jgi:catechol 2,3-dioxygenase-like lactoylglutathione lyase family enzyme
LSHFAVVRVNVSLTLDFANSEEFDPHHYAFHVSDQEFDASFARVKEAGLEYSSDPMHRNKGQINHIKGNRGFYFLDSNGHNLKLLTRA